MQAIVTKWLDDTSKRYPNKTAIYDEHEKISYSQYRSKSLGIASAIIRSGIGTRKPIVVYMEKCAKVLVSFAGVAYSGNFYSPIDVDMPESRVNKIFEVLEPALVITTAELKEKVGTFDYCGDVLVYEDIETVNESAEVNRVAATVIDTDLLYVLFTSGSTGVPKGVCITHRGVIDYIEWVCEKFSICDDDSFGNQAPFYFDNSILDIYSCMKTGATLYIIPKALFSQPVRLLEYLNSNRISNVFWVPSALTIVSKLKALEVVDISASLKRVMFAGEVMPNRQLNVWRKYLPDAEYVNLYGPTEITDACTYYIVNRSFKDDEPLPIGFPIPNMDILLLDDQNGLVTEPGITGELCVRGTGVASGYYNNPEKTKQVFVQNPLFSVINDIIYRTGDLACYNENGEILYLSRKDFQIKHMGHRIELGEIETAISSFEEVSQSCCLYNEKRSRIVAFMDANLVLESVNERLKNMIPEYMFPGQVIYMEKMPLNANGKIDRIKLMELL